MVRVSVAQWRVIWETVAPEEAARASSGFFVRWSWL